MTIDPFQQDCRRRRLVWRTGSATLALLCLLGAADALAQQAVTEEIVVTGSRIARPNLTQPNPVQVVGSETIQALGMTSTVDVINQLPQTQNNMTMATSNRFINGAGVAFTNLRGMGEYRTLTLIDGKRHVGQLSGRNGSGGTSLVDLNTIPPALIDRVEVVTGGSSAVYGADAVAGVVNIILKKNYEGAEISTQYKASEEAGYRVFNVNGLIGANLANGRGNVTLAFDYNHDSGLWGRDRESAMNNLTRVTLSGAVPGDGVLDGITIQPTKSSIVAGNGAAVIKTALRGPGSQYTLAVNTNGSGLVAFNRGRTANPLPSNLTSTGDLNAVGGEGINNSQYLQLSAPNIRMVADTLINYEIAEKVGFFKSINFFADVKYANSRGTVGINGFANNSGTSFTTPDGNGTGNGSIAVRADNPFVPTDLRALLATNGITGAQTFDITRNNYDWYGSRDNQYEYSTFRAVSGFRGDLENGWKYEAYYNYGRNRAILHNKERILVPFTQQIDATVVDGQVVCRNVAARTAGCVPLNPFVVGSLTPAQLNFAHTYTSELSTITQMSAGANITGDIFSYPTLFSGTLAPIGFAAGVEWRREHSEDYTDYLAQQPNAIYGNNVGPGPIGSYISREAFLELNVPLLRDLPVAKAVDLGLAYRYTKNSSSGSANTWNVNLGWAINDDVKIRGAVARAVRTPSLDDLLSPPGDNFLTVPDPCSVQTINASPTRLANCRAAGAPVGYDFNNFAQAAVRTGGNPNLKPEVGSTLTAGVVFTPTFIPGLNVTADYWWIRVTGGNLALAPTALLSGCYDSGNATSCAGITRRSDFSLARIAGETRNIGKELSRGVDLGVSYTFDLDRVGIRNAGTMLLGFDGTWNPENIVIQDPALADSAPKNSTEGKLFRAGSVGYPHLRGSFRAVWDFDNLTVTWQQRFIGKSEFFPNGYSDAADFSTIPTVWYTDLSARYRWRNLTGTIGVNNAFDKQPPRYPWVYQGSYQGGAYATFPGITTGGSTYDVYGRTFFARLGVKF